MSCPIHILGISGSLRQKSHNAGLLRAAAELLPEGVTLELYDISQIPVFNEDLESNLPEPVKHFAANIQAADALLFATPEYNHGLPGPLKNALDWVSRPAAGRPFDGKPVAIMGASTAAVGSARAQAQLRQTAAAMNMFAVNRPFVVVPHAASKFDVEGRLTDEATRKLVGQLVQALVDWTRRIQN